MIYLIYITITIVTFLLMRKHLIKENEYTNKNAIIFAIISLIPIINIALLIAVITEIISEFLNSTNTWWNDDCKY